MTLDDLGNMPGVKAVEKIYDDGLSSATKETGRALTDIAKSFRHLSYRFQFAASLQDRLDKNFKKSGMRFRQIDR